jgi:hypothetical protein
MLNNLTNYVKKLLKFEKCKYAYHFDWCLNNLI